MTLGAGRGSEEKRRRRGRRRRWAGGREASINSPSISCHFLCSIKLTLLFVFSFA